MSSESRGESREEARSRNWELGSGVGLMTRFLREERGFSISELAARAHISPMQLSRIERLHSSPTEATIRRIAAALDVLPGVLFGDLRDRPDSEADLLINSTIEKIDRRLIQLINQAADARRELRPIETPAMTANRLQRERSLQSLRP